MSHHRSLFMSCIQSGKLVHLGHPEKSGGIPSAGHFGPISTMLKCLRSEVW